MRTALDACVPLRALPLLINAGYVVVYVAKEGQPDEFWVREAIDRGVDVIVSPDSDVVALIQDTNIVVVKPPKGKADTALVTSIIALLENLRTKNGTA